jgi:hypothetical protein
MRYLPLPLLRGLVISFLLGLPRLRPGIRLILHAYFQLEKS